MENEMIQTTHRVTAEFANSEKAKTILCKNDEYIQAMHPLERSLKMQVQSPVSEHEYLAFLAQNVLEWNDNELDILKSSIHSLNTLLVERQIYLFENIVFIKTTGREEWNSAYTRSNAIILPERKLYSYKEPIALLRLLAHEYFHIITRKHPKLRTALYNIIGFHRIESGSPKLPDMLRERMVTNPDAPRKDHYISLSYQGKPVHVIPITVLRKQLSTIDSTQDIIESIMTQLLVIERKNGTWMVEWVDGNPYCLAPHQVEGLEDQFDDNTEIVIEPEEILAEHFVSLLTSENDIPTPGILDRMKTILVNH